MRTARRLAFILPVVLSLAAAGIVSNAAPQDIRDSNEARTRLANFERHKAMRDASPFKGLPWTFVGPVRMTGRMSDAEAIPGLPGTIYAAAAQGGVFKTSDEGKNWTAIFEDYPTASIGDIALAPSDPNVVWVGTGEANILRSTMAGIGVFKSTDAGRSFQYMGLADTQHVSRIIVHPKNPDIVYVASAGHEYTFSPDRGVYKTTNGGRSWEKVFYKDEKTAVIDLAMDPEENDTLYAGTAERLRLRWSDPRPGPQSGIYKTTDGGKTWKALTNGLPDFAKGEYERVGLDVCRSNPKVVYAVINGTGAFLYRSEDKGESWRLVEGNDAVKKLFPGYGWVFGQVRVAPSNPDIVYVLGLNVMRSRDGGKTWENVKGNHVDYHGMWMDPKDPAHSIIVDDGGVMITHDDFASFTHPANVPIAQQFNIAVSQTKGKFWMYSNIQDSSAYRGEVDMTAGRDKVTWTEWVGAPGDESGRHAVDPTDPNLVYYTTRYGGGPFLMDYSQPVKEGERVRGKAIAPDFGSDKKRAQWVAPIVISPHSPKRVLWGAQFVFVTDDGGAAWRRISPDLTNFDPAKQGNIPYSTIWAIAESPLKKGLIYAGTDDGNVQVTKDEGATWTKVIAGLPAERFVSSLEASRFAEGTVYVTMNGKRQDDFTTYVYISTDYGQTWTPIAGDCPGGCANVLKEDPENGRILYLGTDLSVYVTTDGGRTWQVLGSGLPTAFVFDLAIQNPENVLVTGTHGRGSWLIDLLPVRASAQK